VYGIRKVQENQVGFELNGAHQLSFYADDINFLCDNVNNIKGNMEALDCGHKTNAEKTKYKFISHHRNSGEK
jgi:hypothetical protein